MQAIILAGGKGTRLRPLTVYTPKPIVPVLNRPFLLYQIDILRNAGVTDITLSLSYQPDKIEMLLGSGAEHGVSLTYITEPNPLGTGGAYRFAANEIRETTIVLNGDVLTDIDLTRLLAFHAERKAEATIVLTPVEDPQRYGLVETDNKGSILRFLEKPSAEDIERTKTNTINAGIYVLEPSVLDLIPYGENRSFEYDVFPELLRRKSVFCGYVMQGEYWRDIGTPASYREAHLDILAGRFRTAEDEDRPQYEKATAAAVDAVSVIGADCVIKPNARISNSVLGPGVNVEEKALIENSVIWGHTRIAANAIVRDSIVGRSCHIGRNALVTEGAVLGDKTQLTDYTQV
ncbi:MAG: NDP-sugar synthase [Chloracidobacterium sp.]|nr:NDP-sugar synthase [Chloracidobacterium sp.]MCO5333843.1 NDP-sugar synthase [Pyrinomonadaceae bacterium]